MNAAEVMTREVAVISPEDVVQKAAQIMRSLDAGSLPVGENNRLVGMITDRDIALRAVADNKSPLDTKVRDVMSTGVLYCFEDEDLDTVAEHMAEWQVRRLAVLDRENRLVGIISIGDIAKKEAVEVAASVLRANAR